MQRLMLGVIAFMLVAGVAIVGAGTPASASIQDPSSYGGLWAYVRNVENQPVQGARIEVYDSNGQLVNWGTTGSGGGYLFGLPGGHYKLKTTATEYATKWVSATVIDNTESALLIRVTRLPANH